MWPVGFGQHGRLTPEPLDVARASLEDLSPGEPGASWEHWFSREVLLIHRYPRVRGLLKTLWE